MFRPLLAAALSLLWGCYATHEREGAPDASPSESAIEIGGGFAGFEALPASGGVVELQGHVRGGWGVWTTIRVRGLAPGGEVFGEGVDPVTGETLAAARADERHRIVGTEGDWSVSSSAMLLFEYDAGDPARLDGRALLLRATAPAADGALLVDERQVTIAAPGTEDECATWRAEVEAEWEAIRACTDASECGQDIPLLCGCTRNPVARLDADISRFFALLDAWPTRPDGTPCDPPDIPAGSTCDCPPADGYRCRDGFCEWNLR